MRAIDFEDRNVVIAENQKEYIALPAHKSNDGIVTTCWELSFWERISVIFTGRIYLQIMTFNNPLQPLNMSVNNLVQED